jgi:hypothetical protein
MYFEVPNNATVQVQLYSDGITKRISMEPEVKLRGARCSRENTCGEQ